MALRIAIAIETTSMKTFATAVHWPGWSRSGRTIPAALDALSAYAARYASVAAVAGYPLPAEDLEFEVVESAEGGSGTEFGVPSRVADADRRPTSRSEAERRARLVAAAWACLDGVTASAPESLRKGPRGGGRDTSKIIEHTLMADHAYAREMGLRLPAPSPGDAASVAALREAMDRILRAPVDGSPLAGRKWTVRYAAHRIAWHSLDHAWEIEDRSMPEAEPPP